MFCPNLQRRPDRVIFGLSWGQTEFWTAEALTGADDPRREMHEDATLNTRSSLLPAEVNSSLALPPAYIQDKGQLQSR